jgi:CO/xanthine dehydrogenase FAD-binding subunit
MAGGTDLMVELNFDRRRPERILDLNRVAELAGWHQEGDELVIGAGMTHTRLVEELAGLAPGLAIAARTVGSPQIRNRGTIGGNLATASPAGDALPPLVAADARVEVASSAGTRTMPLTAFCTGPRRNALAGDELITAVRVPVARGPQQFAKVGPRNAMVIAVCSLAVSLDPEARTVGAAIGSAAPTVIRAGEAERFVEGAIEEAGAWESRAPLPAPVVQRFGELVGAAARPIDDVRGSAAYRRHALAVLGRRTLSWCWDEYRA